MSGRIQKQDVKTETEVIADGGLVSDLINDTQIYTSVLNKTLDQAILDGDIGGSGGGSGSFIWSNLNSNGPMTGYIQEIIPVFLFSQSDEQEISSIVVVPEGYTPGVQIVLKNISGLGFSSGDVFLETSSYLIKNGSNLSSLGTPHVDGKEESLTANLLRVYDSFELTDSDGEINSVAVGSGDLIVVKLKRKPGSESSSLNDDFNLVQVSAYPVFEE